MENLFLVLRVIVSLAVVLGLLYVLRRKLVPRSGSGQRRDISVVARQGIGAKASVALIEVGGKRYLLGVGDQSVNVLDSYVAPAEEEQPGGNDRGRLFALNLDDARHRSRGPAGPGTDTPETDVAEGTGTDAYDVVQDGTPAPEFRRDLRGSRNHGDAAHTREPASPLAGSILSAQTWRQAAAAWRRGPS
ncbi:flagellar biosynthetic protein FliO [Arthrobacter sp. JSM 101049]|uniref:flagellar biosynthetic protein FliO n=1 Tax=Arthrobacter sp. JSM 101049 TaxID=929097 RepID=UPI003566B163